MILLRTTFILLIIYSFSPMYAQTVAKNCNEIDKVVASMTKYHYQPIEISETVKKEIIELYVNDMDEYNRFLTTEDLSSLKEIAVIEGLCASYFASEKLYYKGINKYDSLVKFFLKAPVKFKMGEVIKENATISSHLRKSDFEYDKYILQLLKLDYLYIAKEYAETDSIIFLSEKQITSELDKEWREKILKIEEMYLQRLQDDPKVNNKNLFEKFLNAITLRFDPHSNYFSVEEMVSFEEELSRETSSFGVQLAENEDYEIEVSGIVPGSAAWFSGEFTVGDIVESVTTKKKETFVFSLRGMKYVSKILKNPLYTELTFNVKKESGDRRSIFITKTEIENIDNTFRAYLMQKDSVKLGYIALPSFYTDFESDNMLGCANDVAKEIILLKKEGINGLVLDLRNNGGGSIKEAVELCGLFISEGPVCVLQVKDEKPYLLKDMNRGTVYDGPLIILVNNSSASASEVVAGCLQDYHRALIVGDVTYGKGSAQSIYKLDQLSTSDTMHSNGQVKVTDGRFYHISSRSNQSSGIIPDIKLLDQYSSVDFFKEKYTNYHLENDSTSKKIIYTKHLSTFSDPKIKMSQSRIDNDAFFKQLKIYSDSLKVYVQEDQFIPLDFMHFIQYSKEKDAFIERFRENKKREDADFVISNHAFVDRLMNINPVEKKRNDELIKQIQSDPVIQESLRVFKESINY